MRLPPTIEGVGTNIAAFAGVTERGPDQPTLLASWADYQNAFGGYLPETVSYLPFAVQGFFENGGREVYVSRVAAAGGSSTGDAGAEAAHVSALAAIEALPDVSLVAVPDEVRFASGRVTAALVAQCDRLKNRFGIVSAPRGLADITQVKPPADSMQAAFYYPWIEVAHPVSGLPLRLPPSGHVAGLIARVDEARGVYKAPANEAVRAATGLEFTITDGMQQTLAPRGVNVIRDFRNADRGIVLWGARTMSSDSEWKYINVRRFFVFVEQSIDTGLQWVGFEPNGEPLWALVKSSIENFLSAQWRSGALMGAKPSEAFYVRCDRTTMTQDDIDNGRLIGIAGIAPVRPAEFVILRFSHKTAGS